jgi:hypothetical protein
MLWIQQRVSQARAAVAVLFPGFLNCLVSSDAMLARPLGQSVQEIEINVSR